MDHVGLQGFSIYVPDVGLARSSCRRRARLPRRTAGHQHDGLKLLSTHRLAVITVQALPQVQRQAIFVLVVRLQAVAGARCKSQFAFFFIDKPMLPLTNLRFLTCGSEIQYSITAQQLRGMCYSGFRPLYSATWVLGSLDPTIGNSAGKAQSVFILLAGVLVRTRTFMSPYFLNRTESETGMGENPKEY